MKTQISFAVILLSVLAPLANASLTLSTSGNTVTLAGSGNDVAGKMFVVAVTGAGLSSTSSFYAYPDLSIQIIDPAMNQMLLDIVAGFAPAQFKTPLVAGQELAFANVIVVPPVNGTLVQWVVANNTTVTLIDIGDNANALMAANVVPEPATIALFALGGLMLRKRKV